MNRLAELQILEFGQSPSRKTEGRIGELRGQIPASILVHYDRLMARGKKGVVPVRNQNCTGCHMRVSLAVVMTLRHADDVQLCENCGRYLYLPDEESSSEPVADMTSRKTSAKRVGRKPAKPASGARASRA